MAGTSILSAEEAPAQQPVFPLSEEGLKALDALSEATPIDSDLLQATPARDLTECLDRLVSSLRSLDAKKVQSKTGWWDRLVGADVEAQLEFELACQSLSDTCAIARDRADAARQTGSLLWKTSRNLERDQDKLSKLIRAVQASLPATPSNFDPDIKARFERRLANLMALHAANMLTLKQIDLSIGVLRGLLDRQIEIDQLVKPLWERVSLAAAQGPNSEGARGKTANLAQLHASLVTRIDNLLQGNPHV